MGFTLKHTSVLSNNKGRETQPQVVWRDFCGSQAPGFPPCLKAYQKTPGVQARGMVSLQGPKYATAIQGGLNLPLALMKEEPYNAYEEQIVLPSSVPARVCPDCYFGCHL